ncbi:MAG: hypothetical protein ACK4UJ_02415 [Leptonema sp. (in: bacteria)]
MKFLRFLRGILIFLRDDIVSLFTLEKVEGRLIKLFLYLSFFLFLIKLLFILLGFHKEISIL